MRKIAWLLALALCSAGSAQARPDEHPTVELFGGPSLMRNGVTAPSFSLYGGWQAQGSYNFNSHFGMTTDFGGQYRSISGTRVSQYEYLFGPRVMTRIQRVKLFGHGLVGANTFRVSGQSTTGFAAGVGGGLDYEVSRHFAVRVIQADYLRTRLSNAWFHDARIGVGVVFGF
jgi:opacity protein-like surface antigen